MSPSLLAFSLCLAAVAVEGLAAGGSVKMRFAELRLPPWSPPLPAWIGIGVAYYAMCFVILRRVLTASRPSGATTAAALGLVGTFMLANAAWGLLFFRRKDLRLSFLAFPPYAVLTLVLAATLWKIDRIAAIALVPYLLYLVYATWWAHRLWRLNER